ncbi:MAG: AraC family transcriptional regulator [Rhizorhabdus sp.]|nr:AraC family transcriptional regulator [Rhizorhabdus sp.]
MDKRRSTVVARLDLPLAVVELVDLHITVPQEYRAQPYDNVIEMALTERPGPSYVRYPNMPVVAARPVGEIVFVPGGHILDVTWSVAGHQRVIRCAYRKELEDEPRAWTIEELTAALDVRSPPVRKALLGLAEEMTSPGFRSSLLAESLTALLAVELGRFFRRRIEHAPPGQLSPSQLRIVDERIDCEGGLPTAAELARDCGLSKRHFFRLFRQTTGTSLVDYATSQRILRAKNLLRDEGLVVKQIAHRCGFQTPAAFSAAFRRVTGMTPREYRQGPPLP